MNNEVRFVCLWYRVPPDFVVQINDFFSLVLFSAVIYKRRRKKLISKRIKYKLDSSSKMKFVFFILKTFKNYRFCQKSENEANSKGREWARGAGHVLCVIMTQCIQKRIWIHALLFLQLIQNFDLPNRRNSFMEKKWGSVRRRKTQPCWCPPVKWRETIGSRYSRMKQVKFVEDNL